jgi:hypothetical protein
MRAISTTEETSFPERDLAWLSMCRQGHAMDTTFTVICAALLIWISVGNPASSWYEHISTALDGRSADRPGGVTQRRRSRPYPAREEIWKTHAP